MPTSLVSELKHTSEYGGLVAFDRDCLYKGMSLVVPLWTVWECYLEYCEKHGFPSMDSARFSVIVEHVTEGRIILRKTIGLRRRVLDGVGIGPDRGYT